MIQSPSGSPIISSSRTAALAADLPQRRAGESDRDWAVRLNDAGVAAELLGDRQRAVAAFTQALDASPMWYGRASNNLQLPKPELNLITVRAAVAAHPARAAPCLLRRSKMRIRFRISNLTCLAVFVGAIASAAIQGQRGAFGRMSPCSPFPRARHGRFFSRLARGRRRQALRRDGVCGSTWDPRCRLSLMFLAGGLVAICYVLIRTRVAARGAEEGRIPYGIAIAVGALAMIALNVRAIRHHERPLLATGIAATDAIAQKAAQ